MFSGALGVSDGTVVDPDPVTNGPLGFLMEGRVTAVVGPREPGRCGVVLRACEIEGPFLASTGAVTISELIAVEAFVAAQVILFQDGEG